MSVARAAVDCGTNSTRLLVVDGDGRELVRRTVITRLGAGVDATGRLDDAALARTLAVIGEYRDTWRARGVDADHVRVAATSAVRDARDGDRYLAAVRTATGVDAEVLAGDEEARLSFAGAVGAVRVPPPVAVVDVGGGSTEIVVGDHRGAMVAGVSLQVGSVRLTERHLHADPPTGEQVEAARRWLREALDGAARGLAGRGADLSAVGSLVAVAGTATTLGALDAGLEDVGAPSVHGRRIAAADLRGWADRLLATSVAGRRRLTAIPAGRADVIAAGALILAEAADALDVDGVVVSVADLLDGLVATMS